MDQDNFNLIAAYPSETRPREIKAWLDLRTPEGRAKIVTAILALRNFGGGDILVGFDNKTLLPLPPTPTDVLSSYHHDAIQGLVSKYASEPFDIELGFGEREGSRYPVIVVVAGISTPVAVKTALTAAGGKELLVKGTVFFRTLRSNGTVSSSAAMPNDWPEIMQICMDNREADIGRFIRRHLSAANLSGLMEALQATADIRDDTPTLREMVDDWSSDAQECELRATVDWVNADEGPNRPDIHALRRLGTWDVALVIQPQHSSVIADATFYDIVARSIPNKSAWPIWTGFRDSALPANRHRQIRSGWEALIVSTPGGFWDRVEFQRWEATGRFYLQRLHDEDASARQRKAVPGTIFDLGRAATRVAEAIATGLAIANALGWDRKNTVLGFGFSWTNLSDRIATFPFSQLPYPPDTRRKSLDESAHSFVAVPLSTASDAIAPFVQQAVGPLCAKFDGFQLPLQMIEQCLRALSDRKT